MASSGMLRRVALVRTDVSEERSDSFIRVTTIGELGTTLAVTLVFLRSVSRLLVSANVHSSPIVSLMMEAKRLFLQKPYGATSKKTAFFIVTAVRTSNLT
jgi:hypothetical protein